MRNKVLLITNTMAPYRIHLLNYVTGQPKLDLEVWYLQEKESNRKWKINFEEVDYNFKLLSGIHYYIQNRDMGIHINPFFLTKLLKNNPDTIVLCGYDNLAYWTALLYGKLFKKKIVLWWGSTLTSSRVKNVIINKIRSFFFHQINSFLTYGSDATKCLIHYGVSKEKIITGYNTVDIRYFYNNSKNVINNTLSPRFIFIGQLIDRKGLLITLEALSNFKDKKWELLICGTGPKEAEYQNIVKELGISKNVTFLGYKQKDEIVNYLSNSDCLLFPSEIEVWGLVVNEALSCNTFVLSSIYAGVTTDLIIEGQNGLKIDPMDKKDLIDKLNWVFENLSNIRKSKGVNPYSVWKKMHYKTYGKALIKAILLKEGNKK